MISAFASRSPSRVLMAMRMRRNDDARSTYADIALMIAMFAAFGFTTFCCFDFILKRRCFDKVALFFFSRLNGLDTQETRLNEMALSRSEGTPPRRRLARRPRPASTEFSCSLAIMRDISPQILPMMVRNGDCYAEDTHLPRRLLRLHYQAVSPSRVLSFRQPHHI